MFLLSAWLCFLIFVTVTSNSSDTFANFRRTTIINDSCDFSSKLQKQIVGFFTCAFLCGKNKNCRRFLHSKNSLLCNLYSDGTKCILNGDSSGYRCFIKTYGCLGDDCTCPRGYYGYKCERIATDCMDYIKKGYGILENILTNIQPPTSLNPFEIICWLGNPEAMTIFQRNDKCNTENFNRSMHDYEVGFGNVPWNGWIGFDKILPLVNRPGKRVRLDVFIFYQGTLCKIRYRISSFGNHASQYNIFATGFESLFYNYCGDSIMGSNGTLNLIGRPFSTFDSDLTGANLCPARLGGGWWFADDSKCSDSFVTGSVMTDNYWQNNLQDKKLSSVVFKVAYY